MGAKVQEGYTCGCLNLEPFEADGNKATDQRENQQGKEAANFNSYHWLHPWGTGQAETSERQTELHALEQEWCLRWSKL